MNHDSIRVLHVDDEPQFAAMTADFLKRETEAMTVVTERRARDALDRIAEGTVDCVVSDYDMPGMDGLAFLKAVRETHPELPFLLFTGKGSEEIASEAISAGVTDYLQKAGGTDQYAVLANRIENAVDAYRAERRAARNERINALLRTINRRIVAAETPEAVERAVCEAIADSEPYRFAWIGGPDPDGSEIVPRASAGDAEQYLEEVTIRYDDSPEGGGPAGRAVRTGRPQRTADIPTDPSFEPWREVAERYGYESVLVLPLITGDHRYGVLAIYADHPHAFDDAERTVLEELAETIANALRASEARRQLNSIVRRAPEAIYIKDRDRRYELINAAGAERFDTTPEAIVGNDDTAFFDGPELAEIRATDGRVIESGDAVTYVEQRSLDGADRVFHTDKYPIRSATGDVVGLAGFSREITDRVERERDLSETNTVLSALLAALPVGTLVEGADREILVANDTVCDLLDFPGSPEDLIGRDCGAAAADLQDRFADPEGFIEGIESLLSAREPVANEELALADGRTLERSYVPYSLPTGEANLWLYRDVTDRREGERELKRQNERLDTFASVLNNDLRNPLNVLKGSIDLADATGDPEHFDACREAADRMQRVIEDVLTMAREGETVSAVTPVGLARIVEDCWQSVENPGTRLRVETDATVRADSDRLRRLLENLLRNAVEHGSTSARSGTRPDASDRDGTTVTVTVGDLADGFYVEDDGPGIPPDEREAVFEMGYSTSREGTGLGLSIAAQIADAHGWTMTATEGTDGGARFEITGVDAA